MLLFHDISEILNRPLEFPLPETSVSSFAIDSRKLQLNDLFVALSGVRDGHDFLEHAFQRGAGGALIRQNYNLEPLRQKLGDKVKNIIRVPDPEKALLKIAAAYRRKFPIPFVGITGSLGKTSVKQFLTFLLSLKHQVHSSKGNFNNHLGLPLTLMGVEPRHDVCVAELGANHVGEISTLAAALGPTHAILTQVAPVHLEGFGNLDAIYEAKWELVQALPRDAFVILPDDNPKLRAMAKKSFVRSVWVGKGPQADYQILNVETKSHSCRFELRDRGWYEIPTPAPFQAQNAVMAMAMAELLGISMPHIPREWDMHLPDGRFQEVKSSSGVSMVYDGYNASPLSFEKSLEAFKQLPSKGRKIVVFSDMLELGHEAEKYHRLLGEQIAAHAFDFVLAYGKWSKLAIETIQSSNSQIQAQFLDNQAQVLSVLQNLARAEDHVLLKASRGMRIERVLQGMVD